MWRYVQSGGHLKVGKWWGYSSLARVPVSEQRTGSSKGEAREVSQGREAKEYDLQPLFTYP